MENLVNPKRKNNKADASMEQIINLTQKFKMDETIISS